MANIAMPASQANAAQQEAKELVIPEITFIDANGRATSLKEVVSSAVAYMENKYTATGNHVTTELSKAITAAEEKKYLEADTIIGGLLRQDYIGAPETVKFVLHTLAANGQVFEFTKTAESQGFSDIKSDGFSSAKIPDTIRAYAKQQIANQEKVQSTSPGPHASRISPRSSHPNSHRNDGAGGSLSTGNLPAFK